jgi:hypothetical protein
MSTRVSSPAWIVAVPSSPEASAAVISTEAPYPNLVPLAVTSRALST